MSLWLPIILSAVIVFLVSFILHTVLTYHRTDFRGISAEDEAMEALRSFEIPPGDYAIPYCSNPEEMKSEAFLKKYEEGPVAFMTVVPPGPFSMGKSLAQWFIYCLVVSFIAAYVASRALGSAAHYLSVFRFVGCVAFTSYSLALAQNSIWYKRSWSGTLKSMMDGLIYALFTAGTFGWLWPG